MPGETTEHRSQLSVVNPGFVERRAVLEGVSAVDEAAE
jgi:hypothetical protein